MRTAYRKERYTLYTLNDFFCGAGGLGIGFKDAGFDIEKAWDFDKYAVQTYKENVGDHVEEKDITTMTIEDVPKATAWTFGFPCQDLSVAGNQAGMETECNACGTKWKLDTNNQNCPNCQSDDFKAANRSGLFFEIMRLLDEATERESQKRPLVIMAENVKALRKYLPILETEYAKRGYKAYYTLYNSKYWDVPQNRERYFVVGIRDDIDAEFIFPTEQHDYVPKLSSVLETNVDEKYYISDEKARTIIDQALKKLESLGYVHATITPDRVEKRQNGRRAKTDEEEMFTLTAQDLHGVIIDDTFGYDKEPRVYDEASPTLRQSRQGVKVIEDAVVINTKDFGKNTPSVGQTPTLLASDYKEPKLLLEDSAVLRPVRTEYGKAIRKDYEAGNVKEKWANIRQLEPRPDDISNTLTTVLKDNLLLEKQPEIMNVANTNPSGRGMNGNVFHADGLAPTLTTNKGEGIKILEPTEGEIIKVADISKDVLNDNERQRRVYSPEGISPTLLGRSDGPKVLVEEPQIDVVGMLDIKSHDHSRRVHDPEGLSPTVTAVSGGTHHIKVFDYSRYRVRKLTPTEYGRLQGFPMDTWNQVVSNSQAYKQFGNAVTTTVAKAIAERIKEFLDENLPLIEP